MLLLRHALLTGKLPHTKGERSLLSLAVSRSYVMAKAVHPFVLLLILLASSTIADNSNITCYDFDGRAYPDNIQCQGSFTCCSNASNCLPNKLCSSTVQGQLVVPACSKHPWDDSCSEICRYSACAALSMLNLLG